MIRVAIGKRDEINVVRGDRESETAFVRAAIDREIAWRRGNGDRG